MDVQASALDMAVLILPPAAAMCSLWLKRRWQITLVLAIVAVMCWRLLLWSMAIDDAAIAEAFNRIPNPTAAEIDAFNTDGASKGFAFLFGVPIFLLYGAACFLIAKGAQYLFRRYIHA